MAANYISNAQKVAMKTNPLDDVNEYELISTYFTDLFANNLFKVSLKRVGANRNKLADEYCSVINVYCEEFKRTQKSQDAIIDSFFKFYNMYKPRNNLTDKEILDKIVSIFTVEGVKLSSTQKYEILCNVFSMLMSKLAEHVCTSHVLGIILSDRSTQQGKTTFHRNIRATQDYCIQALVDYKFKVKSKFRGDDNSHYIKEIKQLKKTVEEYLGEMDELEAENEEMEKKIKKLSISVKDLKDQNEKLIQLVGMLNEKNKKLLSGSSSEEKQERIEKPERSERQPVVTKPSFIPPAAVAKPSFVPQAVTTRPTYTLPTPVVAAPVVAAPVVAKPSFTPSQPTATTPVVSAPVVAKPSFTLPMTTTVKPSFIPQPTTVDPIPENEEEDEEDESYKTFFTSEAEEPTTYSFKPTLSNRLNSILEEDSDDDM